MTSITAGTTVAPWSTFPTAPGGPGGARLHTPKIPPHLRECVRPPRRRCQHCLPYFRLDLAHRFLHGHHISGATGAIEDMICATCSVLALWSGRTFFTRCTGAAVPSAINDV